MAAPTPLRAACFFILAHIVAVAFVAASSPAQVPAVEDEIRLDGVLDEAVWDRALVVDLPVEVRPGENIPAAARTEALVMYTRTHLVVGFRAFDPEPERIRAHLSDRDNAWADDWVGIVLDTFNDRRRNYLMLVNPLGVQTDRIETANGPGVVWDGIWDAAAAIDDWGWSAELVIPFSTLRFQRSEGTQIWRFDAIRGYPRSIDRQFGAFARDRNNNCYLCQAIEIEGFEGVSPGRNLEIVPTLTAVRTDEADDDGVVVDGDVETSLGATARWGFTTNLALSATVNPDFSQIEADARELELNRPFAIFFDEKRPFFMEGADIFDTRMNAVYTRVIRSPDWGLKVTGSEGRHVVGVFTVDDEVTNILLPGPQGSDATTLEETNTSVAARYRFDASDRASFGFLGTSRSGGDYDNRVAGFDVDLRLSDKDRVVAQILGSRTTYPDEIADDFGQSRDQISDWALDAAYFHEERRWGAWAVVKDVGDDFRADLGFMPRVGFRTAEVGGNVLWTGDEDDWYSETSIIGKLEETVDQEGNLLWREAAVRWNYLGPLQIHAFLRPSLVREGFGGEEFDLGEVYAHICLKPNAHSHAWLNVKSGDAVDYTNVRKGRRLNIHPGFWYRFGKHLRFEASYNWERFDADGARFYDASIAQMNTSWQFNPKTFIRLILQKVDYDFEPANSPEPVDDRYQDLFSQFLFSYKLNPRTVVFVGYSDRSEALNEASLDMVGRSYFAKVGYAFVL
jgi:hypothetical protein